MTAPAPPMSLASAQQLHAAGRATEAERAYAQILTADPSNGDAWFLFGALALETGRPAKAVDRLENAIKLKAISAPCFINLGLAYQGVAKLDKAHKAFAQAVTLDPNLPEAHNSLGVVLLALHRRDEAIAAFRRAIALRPQYPRAHYNLGNALRENGALRDAAASFTEAARLEPRLTQAHANLGVVLQELEDREGAEAAYQRALALNSDEPETLNNLGTLRRGALAFVEAQRLFEKAIAVRPDFAEAHLNLGTAYQGQFRLDEALAQYRRALALGAKRDAVFYNIGLASEYKGEFGDAIDAYRQSLHGNPDYVESRWNKAILHLLSGEYGEGWREYECRFDPRRKKQPRGPFPQVRWDGRRDLPGPLLVWAEQGLGDEVLYCRMAGELAAAGVDVVCEVDRRLMPLVNRSWPTLRTIPKSAAPDAATRSPEIAAQIPMGSLGGFMRPDLASFAAAPAAYLRPDAIRRETYARRLRDGAPPSEIVIGISWASANRDLGPHKSVSLLDWAPILQQPGIRWVDLQYGETVTERADAEAALGVKIEHMPDLDLYKDIDGIAALIAACDLVITVSNTTAHLAAAIGVPVWVLLPRGYGKLWYWGMRETTPWYPSARLFRQARAGKWKEVVDAVAEALRSNPRTALRRVP